MIKFLNSIGKVVLELFASLGSLFMFIALFLKSCSRPFYPSTLIHQILEIGFYSLPVVGLTALFTGAVLALQTYTGFSRFNAEYTIATVVALSITRELAPVLVGLVVSGRISSSIAAEIGTMKVTDQIDALYTLGIDPVRYLIVPRIMAGIITLPLLVCVADIIGIMGGYVIAVYELDFSSYAYISNTLTYLEVFDIISGLIKAAVFGFIITIIGTYYGFKSTGGAQGVGMSTTMAVVSASVLILFANYFITGMLFTK